MTSCGFVSPISNPQRKRNPQAASPRQTLHSRGGGGGGLVLQAGAAAVKIRRLFSVGGMLSDGRLAATQRQLCWVEGMREFGVPVGAPTKPVSSLCFCSACLDCLSPHRFATLSQQGWSAPLLQQTRDCESNTFLKTFGSWHDANCAPNLIIQSLPSTRRGSGFHERLE